VATCRHAYIHGSPADPLGASVASPFPAPEGPALDAGLAGAPSGATLGFFGGRPRGFLGALALASRAAFSSGVRTFGGRPRFRFSGGPLEGAAADVEVDGAGLEDSAFLAAVDDVGFVVLVGTSSPSSSSRVSGSPFLFLEEVDLEAMGGGSRLILAVD